MTTITNFKSRLSYKQKRANNFKWCEEEALKILSSTGYNTTKIRERFKINYNIYNGRGELEDLNDYITLAAMADSGNQLGVTRHFDIISSIASSHVGDEAKRPFNPICVDISHIATTERKNKRLELVQKYIMESIIMPIRQQVEQEVMSNIPVDDEGNPQLNEETTQQVQQEIEAKVSELTLPEIHQYMKKTYKSSGSIMGQKLLEWVIRDLNLKFKFNTAFKNLIITGVPVFHATMYNNKLEARVVNPNNFDYGGTSGEFFIQKADWWKYSEEITISELYRRYGSELKQSEINKIDKCVSSYSTNDVEDSNVISEYVKTEDGRHIDIMTSEGQSIMVGLRAKARTNSGITGNHIIKHHHVAWRALCKYKYITRMDPETGEEVKVLRTESYKFSPEAGDIDEEIFYLPQIWETTIIEAGSEKIFIRKKAMDNQYSSLEDAYNVDGPYFGYAWGSFHGDIKFVAPLDKAKPAAYDYNVVRSKINKIIAQDRGKVLTLFINQKPQNYTIEQWLEMITEDGVLVVDSSKGLPTDIQGMKPQDLTNIQDLAGKLEYLAYLKEEATNAMSYNSSRVGQISPYMTATNNQQNIIQSMSQTEDIYSTFNFLKEKFLTHLVKMAKIMYLKNPKSLSFLLDDYSIAELEIDPFTLELANFAVYISNDTTDIDNLMMSKSLLQSMASSGAITHYELMKSIWSKSGIESLQIAEQSEERRQQELEATRKHDQEMAQQEVQSITQQLQLKQEFELQKLELEYQYKLKIAELESLKFANQYDIDKDNLNDTTERAALELDQEVRENEKTRQHELDKLKLEIEAKKEIAKIQLKKQNKN